MNRGCRSIHCLLLVCIVATTLLTPLVLAEDACAWQQYCSAQTDSAPDSPEQSPLPYTLVIRSQCAMWKQGDSSQSAVTIVANWAGPKPPTDDADLTLQRQPWVIASFPPVRPHLRQGAIPPAHAPPYC